MYHIYSVIRQAFNLSLLTQLPHICNISIINTELNELRKNICLRKSEVYVKKVSYFIHTLSFLLPLIQEGQLSVTGESMCTKYCLTA